MVDRLEVSHGSMLMDFRKVWQERLQHWHLSDFLLYGPI